MCVRQRDSRNSSQHGTKILCPGCFDHSTRNNKMRNTGITEYSILAVKLKQKLRGMTLGNSQNSQIT